MDERQYYQLYAEMSRMSAEIHILSNQIHELAMMQRSRGNYGLPPWLNETDNWSIPGDMGVPGEQWPKAKEPEKIDSGWEKDANNI